MLLNFEHSVMLCSDKVFFIQLCAVNATMAVFVRLHLHSPLTQTLYSSLAPCPPTDVAKSVSCDNRTASISWSAVAGAVTYTATLEQLNGDTACCTTSGTSCDVAELPCGEMYVLHVMAEGRTCNSSESDGDILRTGVGCAASIHDTLKLVLVKEF